MIKKIIIKNYKSIKQLEINFNKDINIIIGNNGAGKSSIFEILNLAFSNQSEFEKNETNIETFLFNNDIVEQYFQNFKNDKRTPPPKIYIEVHFNEEFDLTAEYKGTNNLEKKDCSGFVYEISINNDIKDYFDFVNDIKDLDFLPTEFYEKSWISFSGNNINIRQVNINPIIIDSTKISGEFISNKFITKLIRDGLDNQQKRNISLEYKKSARNFKNSEEVQNISKDLFEKDELNNKIKIALLSEQKNPWNSNLTFFQDEVPFKNIGRGEQNIIKTKILLKSKSKKYNFIMIEEPENHLSFSNLLKVLKDIENDFNSNNQLLISTHSSFVLNVLGINKLILLAKEKETKVLPLSELSSETIKFLKKMPSWDTLRLILSKKIILVEGPSEKILIPTFYKIVKNKEIYNTNIDILSLNGLSFKRALEITKILDLDVYVLTDNDGDYVKNIEKKYNLYPKLFSENRIIVPLDNRINTFEVALIESNTPEILSNILGKKFDSNKNAIDYMTNKNNKTESALIFSENINNIEYNIPPYIKEWLEKI